MNITDIFYLLNINLNISLVEDKSYINIITIKIIIPAAECY